jgi:Protein of unknown function (DUF3014)
MAIDRMNKAAIIVALVLAGGGIYWAWSRVRPAPPPPPAPAPAPPQPVGPDAKAEPQIRYPIVGGAGRPASRGLSGLDDSDRDMRERMAGLFGARRVAEFFMLEGIIRRIVAMVDSLPREQAALSVWPVKPVPGEILVDSGGGTLTISAKNQARYQSRVRLAESVDTRKLVALYVRHYSLFQQAYQDLGYPQGYFNDRLIEVIDHLIAAPERAEPIRVVRGRRYEFADPELQKRSAGEKMLLRMGPQLSARLKTVLRDIRGEIVERSASR